MKYLFSLLLFPLLAIAQNDSISPQNISVISAEKMNVVYRGISNPIKIAFPGAVSFSASAPGMVPDSIRGMGNYILNPGSGNEITVNVIGIMPDGKARAEKKIFKIKGLLMPHGSINGDACDYCKILVSKEELKAATVRILFNMPFINDDAPYYNVNGFTVRFSKNKIIYVEGNKMSIDVIKAINKLKVGDMVSIFNISYGDEPTIDYRRPASIVLEIIPEPKPTVIYD